MSNGSRTPRLGVSISATVCLTSDWNFRSPSTILALANRCITFRRSTSGRSPVLDRADGPSGGRDEAPAERRLGGRDAEPDARGAVLVMGRRHPESIRLVVMS